MVRYVRFLCDWPKSSFHVPHPSCRHDGRKDGSPIVSFAITPSLLLKGSRDSRGFARLLPSFVCRQGTLCPAGAPQLAITGAGWGREQVEHWHGGRRRSGAGRPRGGVCISVQRYFVVDLHSTPRSPAAVPCTSVRRATYTPWKAKQNPRGARRAVGGSRLRCKCRSRRTECRSRRRSGAAPTCRPPCRRCGRPWSTCSRAPSRTSTSLSTALCEPRALPATLALCLR